MNEEQNVHITFLCKYCWKHFPLW